MAPPIKAAFALIPLLLAGCTPAPVVKVAEVLAHCDSYKGKIVRVAGYLGDCGGYDCMLFADKAHVNAFAAARAEQRRIHRQLMLEDRADADGKLKAAWDRIEKIWPIGIGFIAMVEPRLTAHAGRYVILTGRMEQDTCTGLGGTDRAPGIRPTDVRVWTKAAGAPADADDNAPFRPSTTLH